MEAEDVERLLDPRVWPFPVGEVRLVETHISWVVLTGEFAFKIKKPLDLGFLDFSTLARRRHFVEEELRLNRRFAPEIYLGVTRITGTREAPRIDGDGPLIEVAVRMHQFDGNHQLDRELETGALDAVDLEATGREVARFQAEAPCAGSADDWGSFERVMTPVRENFAQMRRLPSVTESHGDRLTHLEGVTERWAAALEARIRARRDAGFVREGHGDLHLSNLARLSGGIRAFDCIEFDPALRWIDVVNEVAFLVMDLDVRGRSDLGWAFLNAWLSSTGDYDGLGLLRFYALYRTLVRAKVSAIQHEQAAPGPGRASLGDRIARHLALGATLSAPVPPRLLVMHGVSGSGKSYLGRQLAMNLGAVHLRSDVERKRLHGFAPDDRHRVAPGQGIYDSRSGDRTYARLLELAGALLDDGHRVLVDATFLTASRRAPFLAGARVRGIPAAIVACDAAPGVLRERVQRRLEAGGDPSDADLRVLEGQLGQRQWPRADEGATVIPLDTGTGAVTESVDALRAWVYAPS